ncbi:MAG: D-cysteine desulfhydrase family protein [Brevefilum sp.]|nr:D-cysteine desulfhydrase family protein [Brevefilum sp.]MDT8382220.1 D-cysteine desulfhydrase family protein [Brevefilum sp.]MDW7754584.1 D-cysteine desulfhydrase family protein [Brevefilum sp.]
MKPRIEFAHLPTKIEALPRLSAALQGPRLYVKRDDQTGLAFGGNKTRKLEYLLAEARDQEADLLITAGAVQSNHCRQTVAAAARFGFDCILVLFGDPPDPPDGNHLLHYLLGADILFTDRENVKAKLEEVFQKAQKDGLKPYLIPYGGSNPTGAMGYVNAMLELSQQDPTPDWIVFPSSSGGTQAGMMVGGRISGFTGKILGISVDEPANALKANVATLATDTAASLGKDWTFAEEEVLVNDDYTGGGYAVMGEAEIEAIRLFAQKEALLLDPVYTGRAAAGLIDLIRKGFFDTSDTVLFWHTGGGPALFTNKYQGRLISK